MGLSEYDPAFEERPPSELFGWGKANGVTELAIPRDVRVLAALPVLGTGKLDYVTMGEIAKV